MSYREFEPPSWDGPSPGGLLASAYRKHFTNIYHVQRGEKRQSSDIAIFVDGACSNNGRSWAQAGMGVYFGPGSRYNITQRLDEDYGPQTNQRAEVNAAIIALQRVKSLLDEGRLNTDLVVIASDSTYLVNGITKWIYKWQDNGWTNARGGDVSNQQDFEELDELVEELEDNYNVFVKFWKVDRDDNQEADELARDALTDEDSYY